MKILDARILVIEDELPMRTALADCLEAEGYRVLTAADGPAGLEKALREKPDLVLLDIMMPRLDGYAVCAELRRLSISRAGLDVDSQGADRGPRARAGRRRGRLPGQALQHGRTSGAGAGFCCGAAASRRRFRTSCAWARWKLTCRARKLRGAESRFT